MHGHMHSHGVTSGALPVCVSRNITGVTAWDKIKTYARHRLHTASHSTLQVARQTNLQSHIEQAAKACHKLATRNYTGIAGPVSASDTRLLLLVTVTNQWQPHPVCSPILLCCTGNAVLLFCTTV
jgi:hypothetical protein